MRIHYLFGIFFTSLLTTVSAQSISTENIEYQLSKAPKILIEKDSRQYSVAVISPYNMTTEDVIAQSKADFQNDLNSFDKRVADSKKEFQQILVDYDSDVVKAKEKYKIESEEFKKLTLLERLTMTDKGQNPKLVIPNKPVYVPLTKPVYREPNLKDYVIIDNNVLASQININGFNKEGNYLTITLDIKKTNFQDNSGQTYANQPTTLIVKQNGEEKINKIFFQDYEFVSTSPTNNINKAAAEQTNVKKVITFINSYLNETFTYQAVKRSVKIQSVKNKGQYDDLEKAGIYVATNLRKLNPLNPEISTSAMTGMQKGIDIWKEALVKVDYKDTKADFNAKIAKFIYFNLMNLNLAFDKKSEAEKFLNQMQENLIYMKLSSSEENELKQIENQIYKTT